MKIFSNYEVNNSVVAGTFLGIFFSSYIGIVLIHYFKSIELVYNIHFAALMILFFLPPILRYAKKFYFYVFNTRFFSLSIVDGFLSIVSPILFLINIFLRIEAEQIIGYSTNSIIGISMVITLSLWFLLFHKAFLDGKYSLKKKQPGFLYVLDTVVLIIFGALYFIFIM